MFTQDLIAVLILGLKLICSRLRLSTIGLREHTWQSQGHDGLDRLFRGNYRRRSPSTHLDPDDVEQEVQASRPDLYG